MTNPVTLFAARAPFLPLETWITIVDGNDEARALFERHYSRKQYKDGRTPKLFVGPGSKLVLTTPCRRALFVWRKFISGDGQTGVNCAIFRNESAGKSSALIAEAEAIAEQRWPGERRYTYVNPKKVRDGVPGWCFIQAGWQPCGITKWNKLLIFERCPQCQSTSHRKSIARIHTLMGNTGSKRPLSFTSSPTIAATVTALSMQAA